MDTWEKNEFTVVKDAWQDDVEDEWDASEEEAPVVIPEKKPQALPKKPAPATKSKQKEEPNKDEDIVETALERKLREQKLQEEADFDSAVQLFGAENIVRPTEISGSKTNVVAVTKDWFQSLDPQTQKDFDAIVEMLSNKFKSFDKSKFYLPFVENLTKTLLTSREVPEIRKIAGVINDLAAVKQKEKMSGAKKPAPSLAGAKKSSNRAMYADFGDFDDDGDGFD